MTDPVSPPVTAGTLRRTGENLFLKILRVQFIDIEHRQWRPAINGRTKAVVVLEIHLYLDYSQIHFLLVSVGAWCKYAKVFVVFAQI